MIVNFEVFIKESKYGMDNLVKLNLVSFFFFSMLLVDSTDAQNIEVQFYHTPATKNFTNIYLGGNITDWIPNDSVFEMVDPDGDGTYTVTVSVNTNDISEIQYKFIPDGNWELSYADPKNPNSSGIPNYNSLLTINDPMFTFVAPFDNSQGVSSSIIKADIAYSSENIPLNDQWKLVINGSEISNAGSYFDPASKLFVYDAVDLLITGRNSFQLEMGTDQGNVSTSSTFYYYDSEQEYVSVDGVVAGETLSLSAKGHTVDDRMLNFSWTQDDSNPSNLSFSSDNGIEITVSKPEVEGEYFINLTATDNDGKSFNARRILTLSNDVMTYHTVDHYASNGEIN